MAVLLLIYVRMRTYTKNFFNIQIYFYCFIIFFAQYLYCQNKGTNIKGLFRININ